MSVRAGYRRRNVVQFVLGEVGPFADQRVDWSAAVVREPWNDVAVDVRDLLPGRLAVVERHSARGCVDGRLDGRRQAMQRRHDLATQAFGQVVQRLVVGLGDDERMPRSQRVRVQEGEHVVVLVDGSTGDVARDNLAEDAVVICFVHTFDRHLFGSVDRTNSRIKNVGVSVWVRDSILKSGVYHNKAP